MSGRRTPVVLALVVTVLTACGVPASQPATPGATDAPGSASPAHSPAGPGSVASSRAGRAPAGVTSIEVAVTGRRVTPAARRFKVRRGEVVRLTVTADRADEFHLHGYDRAAGVRPGRPMTVELVADLPGVFEAELHESGLRLFELQVG